MQPSTTSVPTRRRTPHPAALRIAVLGAGTVGREVVRALLDHGERLEARAGRPLAVTGIAVRDVRRARGLPPGLLTDAPADLVASAETDLVVELMGGETPAVALISSALEAGKPVVTANKHVVAGHGAELEAIARRTRVPLRFEAAVGGGIPVLGPLATELAGNEIRSVRGIVNGTTNFILSLMAEEGRSFDDALAEAQARGYAEADPTADLAGDDAVDKGVILARLAFGTWLDPAGVLRRPPTARAWGRAGIAGVGEAEIEGAAALGMRMRLLASARGAAEPLVSVLPTCVPAAGELGRTSGVTNRIEIEGAPVGSVAFTGPGAGGPATSSAVLGDILAVARGLGSTWGGLPPSLRRLEAPVVPEEAFAATSWYAWLPPAGGALPRDAGVDVADVAEVAGGTALRTPPLTLGAARALVVGLLPDDADVTLYPCVG